MILLPSALPLSGASPCAAGALSGQLGPAKLDNGDPAAPPDAKKDPASFADELAALLLGLAGPSPFPAVQVAVAPGAGDVVPCARACRDTASPPVASESDSTTAPALAQAAALVSQTL